MGQLHLHTATTSAKNFNGPIVMLTMSTGFYRPHSLCFTTMISNKLPLHASKAHPHSGSPYSLHANGNIMKFLKFLAIPFLAQNVCFDGHEHLMVSSINYGNTFISSHGIYGAPHLYHAWKLKSFPICTINDGYCIPQDSLMSSLPKHKFPSSYKSSTPSLSLSLH